MPEKKSPIFNPNKIDIPGGGALFLDAVHLDDVSRKVPEPTQERNLEVNEIDR